MTSIVRNPSNTSDIIPQLRESLRNTNIERSRKSERLKLKETVLAGASGVGILGSALNIANTIIGGGTLELPYVMR